MEKVLVTGGGGFLGTEICKQLKDKGYDVTSYSRKSYPHLSKMGIRCMQGSVTSREDLGYAMKGKDAVIHTAALAGVWGRHKDFYDANVVGTQNVLDVMETLGIPRLVYTSSPSVVFAGKDITGQSEEELSYPTQSMGSYPDTKVEAEKRVLATHGKKNFVSVAIRPHHILGSGDPHFLPRIKEKAKRGMLKKVGDLNNMIDVTYVGNAALAHILALEALTPRSPLGGKAYFVAQERPVNLWEFVDTMIDKFGLPAIKGRISFQTAWILGITLETVYRTLGIYKKEPPMTRLIAFSTARSHYFSHAAAKRDFGYIPRVSLEECMQKIMR
ncbi:MAG: NAD-dependent epimerase/dehydratase family protein [Deltaproteobacteria bacterium]|nr:NAD-dependent epimerase/dehydratase family protein [Deltaproteobacteria bacterium]